ncbi:MAG: urease accessory protein UreF [Rhodospirillales bacterium]|nr:urease accessory protein UreF [Rhodospirillales bacterium]
MPAARRHIITITTTMTTPIPETALLRLLAWLSPAFPTGGFAYSQGIEWAVEAGSITDGASLHAWLADMLAAGSGFSDAVLLRLAHAAHDDPARLGAIAELAAACAPARERLAESENQGSAFVLALRAWALQDGPFPALPAKCAYPVAVGAACGAAGITADLACLGFLQAVTANLISAAVRLVPLGQSAGLAVLAALEEGIAATAAASRTAGEEDLGGFAFAADIAAMRHETQYTRLFRS